MLHNRPASYKTEHTFFSKQTNFPNFQARKNDYGYTTNLVNGNITLYDKHIKLPKLSLVKLKKHRTILEDYLLKSVTISKSKTSKHFVSHTPLTTEKKSHYPCLFLFFHSRLYSFCIFLLDLMS